MREPTSQPTMGLISPTISCEGPSPPGSHLPTTTRSVPNMRPTSRLTAAKISAGSTPRATSAATRCSAACSSASRLSAARDSVLPTAVAISSVNFSNRPSVSDGRASSPVRPTVIAPQSSPSTMIGLASAVRSPAARTASGMSGAVGSSVSKRATRPVFSSAPPRRCSPGRARAARPPAARCCGSPSWSRSRRPRT